MLQNHYVNLTHKRNAQVYEIQVTRKREYYRLLYFNHHNYNLRLIFRAVNHKAKISESGSTARDI